MRHQLLAEGVGTGLLMFLIVGSGIATESLSKDGAARLFAHATAVGLGLGVLVALFQTISGSHFNPSVTLAFWRTGDVSRETAVAYAAAQVAGGIVGVIVANLTFARSAIAISVNSRQGLGLIGSEAIGTFVLVLTILILVRTDRGSMVPAAVGAWVAAIVFATSSSGFANPAVTLSRVLTDSYTGIDPYSVPGFVAAQLLAALGAASAVKFFVPRHEPRRAHT